MPWALILALMVPAMAAAQEKDEVDYEAAEHAVQEAVEALQDALADLQEAKGDDANRALREAMERVRTAQRDLRADEREMLLRRLMVGEPGNVSVFVSEGRPKMGVVIAESNRRSEWDSVGARLSAVTPGGPADEAGLEAGDVIVTANGVTLARIERRGEAPGQKLVQEIQKLDEGDDLVVEYLRDGDRNTATVVVRPIESSAYSYSWSTDEPNVALRMEAPDLERAYELEGPSRVRIRSGAPTVFSSLMPLAWLDMELVEIDEDLGGYFGATNGLLVVRAPDSDEVPLKSGDVILTVGGREPTSPSHAIRIMRSYEPGETMTIDIMRDRRQQTVTVTVPARDSGFLWSPDGP
jgi:C-terminal processing protease CtpA/Prc